MAQETVSTVSNSLSSSKGFPEIRITLIGGRQLRGIESSGKSSVGNTILGRNAFVVGRRTARSVQAEAEVHGRHVTVVDTPGWWWHYAVEETPKFDRLEIIRCTTLCPPGPHAFLLVIPVDNIFPKIYRMSLHEQLEFLSENVWRHTIVLFSCIAPYDDKSFKNNLRKWPDLDVILRKCQNRYHVLNINNRDDSSQVLTLLGKIEELVAQNNHNYFKFSKSVSAEDEREKIRKEKVKQRILAVKSRRTELQTCIKGEEQHLTDIQIVILGASWAARSSAGNLILGEEAFQVDELRTTVCCEVRDAEVHGRHLTVVDTPGWYCQYPLENTSEFDKLEIRRSVHLCPPGPHAILLTVPIATAFNTSYKTAVEEHMGLLGKEVWSHTIVLFTRGDWLGDTTIEERIEEEGDPLEWLMEQCGYRYHVVNCKNPTDSTQVTELLKKIEEMVMENNGGHYVPDEESNPCNELELKQKKGSIDIEKGRRRKYILQELLKERKEKLSEVRIVLLGGEGVGKSTSGNMILQGTFFDITLDVAFKPQPRTKQCMVKQRNVEGCQILVVDTPGWSTSNLEDTKEIVRSVTICPPGPHAFLLVHPINKAFTKKDEETVMELMSLFGEHVWRYTLIIFSGDWLKDRPVEHYIASEGEALQTLIRKCENRYHALADNNIKNLLEMIEEMVARNKGEYFTQKKRETGKVLTEEEWNKREDELIERMLEAAVVDLDAESKQPSGRRRQSFDNSIPNMSGDSLSDISSLVEANDQNPAVSQWPLHSRNNAPSSGYDTISITSSSQHSKMESVEDDIPMTQNHPSDMDSMVPDEESNPCNEHELKLNKGNIDIEKGRRLKHILQELLKERKENLSEVRIVLLGGEGVGKSTSGNMILQGTFFDITQEEAFKPQPRTKQCMVKQRNVEGCQILVVDTPGWSTSNLEDTKEIVRSVTICPPGPHAFLLVLPVNKAFTKKDEETVMELMSLFGEHVWRYTLIIFSGDWLKDRPVEHYIASEGEALQTLIRKCENRYHALADNNIKNLLEMIEEMVARNKGEYFTQKKRETGKVLTEEEWNKREDKLIERMLEAAVVDLDAESKQPSGRRRQSFDNSIPNMSGDLLSDTSSLVEANALNPAVKVSQWLFHSRNNATSSGFDTISITSSSQHSKMESVKDDIPMTQNHPSDMDKSKYPRNIREQKRTRSSSI